MRFIIILISFLIFSGVASAQKENKIWYFGDKAGLDFNFNPPQALTNSQMAASEGCGVVCDTNGKLLFYSNGLVVLNKNHWPMPMGVLFGHGSATQNGVVASHPGDSTLCFVFSTGAQEGGGMSGFRYSIVDMTMENGLGDKLPETTFCSNAVPRKSALPNMPMAKTNG